MNDDMLQPAGSRSVPNSRLTCAQCERMVLDAIDGTLLADDQAQFDLHIAGCAACQRAMADAQRGSAWLEMLKMAPPEPPSLLLEQILLHTSGDPAIAIPLRPRESIFAYAGAGVQDAGGAGQIGRVLPFPQSASRSWFARLAQGAMQPRFAMTAAMAFFSIALTMNLTGVQLSDIHASSLRPSSLRHGFWSANAKMFRYYDNLRVVYEMESRVRQLQRESDQQESVRPQPAAPANDARPAENTPKKQGGGHSSLPPEAPRSRALRTARIGLDVVALQVVPLSNCSLTASAALLCGEGARS